MPATYVLTLSCPDRPGLVYAVTRWITEAGGNILDSQQYTELAPTTAHAADRDGEFFLRVHVDFGEERDVAALAEAFAPVANGFSMRFSLVVAERPLRTLVMVSKEGHCLNDLLYRQSTGSLNVEVPAVVGNHRDLERLASVYDVPFHHVPVTKDTKPEVEAEVLRLVEELDVDLVVLARYMQILSDDLCRALSGRAINIHHSFLPSFKGARPYHQAHDRGVKLIGATAHYVTADLDEGPIIEQDTVRVTHAESAAELARRGADVERQVLSRAVLWHAQNRVIRHGNHTIVF